MKPDSGINNRWKLLESVVGIEGIRDKFNAYGWYNDADLKITRDEHWYGWWNECFDFISIFPNSYRGKRTIQSVAEAFAKNGWTIEENINYGISIHYNTMTQEESHEKAVRNLLNGGRMSD